MGEPCSGSSFRADRRPGCRVLSVLNSLYQPLTRGVARMAREPVFVARGLTKIYHMGEVDVHALRGVDLDLYPGEFVVLLGPSGSGKSTLLNILGGLDVPTEGHVNYRGRDLMKDDDALLTGYPPHHVRVVF